MRRWYKYLLNYADEDGYLPRDMSFEDHKKTMGYGDSTKGYDSKNDFFNTFFYDNHPRHRYYHDYLKRHLEKTDSVLSLGSGRCVNELLLIEEGFNIVCSDLEQPCKVEMLRLFPHLKFIKFDITRSLYEYRLDCIISLSMFYLFDREELLKVFTNVAACLKPGGKFIFDLGGTGDNFVSRLIDDFILKYETALIRIIKRAINKRCVVTKKHQGYRYSDNEIISIASNAGFRLCDVQCGDYLTELCRSRILGMLPDRIVLFLGRATPYVRMFTFVKQK